MSPAVFSERDQVLLADALRSNSSIHWLSIGGSAARSRVCARVRVGFFLMSRAPAPTIGEAATTAFAQMIASNSVLTCLSFFTNEGAFCAARVGGVLLTGACVAHTHNTEPVSTASGNRLLEALKENRSLRRFRFSGWCQCRLFRCSVVLILFSGDSLPSDCCDSLVDVISNNSTLQDLTVRVDLADDAQICRLFDALRINSSLTWLQRFGSPRARAHRRTFFSCRTKQSFSFAQRRRNLFERAKRRRRLLCAVGEQHSGITSF